MSRKHRSWHYGFCFRLTWILTPHQLMKGSAPYHLSLPTKEPSRSFFRKHWSVSNSCHVYSSFHCWPSVLQSIERCIACFRRISLQKYFSFRNRRNEKMQISSLIAKTEVTKHASYKITCTSNLQVPSERLHSSALSKHTSNVCTTTASKKRITGAPAKCNTNALKNAAHKCKQRPLREVSREGQITLSSLGLPDGHQK